MMNVQHASEYLKHEIEVMDYNTNNSNKKFYVIFHNMFKILLSTHIIVGQIDYQRILFVY